MNFQECKAYSTDDMSGMLMKRIIAASGILVQPFALSIATC
jgi:hypothetical protein